MRFPGRHPVRPALRLGAGRALALAAIATVTAITTGPAGPFPAQVAAASRPSDSRLVGQKLIVAMEGTTASPRLLARIRAGEVGGVILFGSNVTSAGQLAALTGELRAAAAEGGQPPLLVATDQEGGSVKRLPWAAPSLAPPQMGVLDSTATAEAQGRATGRQLACAGVNTDLAPVADVPSATASFLYRQGRTWSFDADVTTHLAAAFAAGLRDGHDLAVMKHFPGLGDAIANTDTTVVTIGASKAALEAGLQPYRAAIADGLPMIMLSNATYTAYDPDHAAGWSQAISVGLLRDTLGFEGVSMTDSLTGAAAARGVSATSLAAKAARAGTDMILLTGSESATAGTYAKLLERVRDGRLSRATLETSYDRIVSLKTALPTRIRDATPPTVGTPESHLSAVTGLGETRVPVVTDWTAADGCGVSSVVVERSVNGGPWKRQAGVTPATSALRQPLRIGDSYRYRVRATDGAGNTSAWRTGPVITARVRQETASAVVLRGAWTEVRRTGASGGAYASSTTQGASASYTFRAAAIAWVAERGPSRGSAAVYVDGTYRTTVSLYAPAFEARRIVYARHWSANGLHAIRIVVLGTVGHPRVDVDAFVLLVRG